MIFLWLVLVSLNVFSFEIDESKLITLAQKESPKLDEIKSRLLSSESTFREVDDSLAVNAYGGYDHTTTNEKAIVPFFPVYSPINRYQIGLKKNFKYGISADISASVDQRSGANSTTEFKDIHTTIYDLTLNFDLWQNLFGKLTRLKIDNAKLSFESGKIQSKIEEKAFVVAIRRLYWNLVGNAEKIRISQNLLEQAQKQAADARRRRRNSIADAGEVARYESQVASRKGSLLLLEYQREQFLKALTDLVPSLAGKDISLAPYNVDKSIFDVLSCTEIIAREKKVPYKYTYYDEMTELLKSIQKNQSKLDSSYDDIDVKLSTSFRQVGVASEANQAGNEYTGSYQESLDDMANNDRSAFQAGLMVTIPLGSQDKTAKVKEEYNKRRLDANIKSTDNNIVNTHNQIARQIKILQEVIRTQRLNSDKLNIRLKDMRKKFSQARVSVTALIQDQDALLNSDLSIIDTQLEILNTLLDYFTIFTDTPCEFNR
jgi:outer membrane protein TolC